MGNKDGGHLTEVNFMVQEVNSLGLLRCVRTCNGFSFVSIDHAGDLLNFV